MSPQFRLCFECLGVLVQIDFTVSDITMNVAAAHFIRSLAHTKARAAPPHLRQATITPLMARWTVSLTHAAMHAYAASLLSMPCEGAITGEDALPLLGELPAQHPEAATMDFPFWIFFFGFRHLRFRRGGFGACSSKKERGKKNVEMVWHDLAVAIGLGHRCVHCMLRCFVRKKTQKHVRLSMTG